MTPPKGQGDRVNFNHGFAYLQALDNHGRYS